MISSKAEALGIIFPNSYDSLSTGFGVGAFDGLHSICQQIPYV